MERHDESPREGGRSAPESIRDRFLDHPLVRADRLTPEDLAAVDACESLSGSMDVRLASLGLADGWNPQKEAVPSIDLEAIGQPDPAVLAFTDDGWAEYRSVAPLGWDGEVLQVVMGGWEEPCGLLELQIAAGAPLRRFVAPRETFMQALRRWTWPATPERAKAPQARKPELAMDPLLTAWWEAGRQDPEPFRKALAPWVAAGKMTPEAARVLEDVHAWLGREFATRSDRYGETLTDDADFWGDERRTACQRDLAELDSCLGGKLLQASWLLQAGTPWDPDRGFEGAHRRVVRMVTAARAIRAFWKEAGLHQTLGDNHPYFGRLHERIRSLTWEIPSPDEVDVEVAARILEWRPGAER
jgi:hypothetical protein